MANLDSSIKILSTRTGAARQPISLDCELGDDFSSKLGRKLTNSAGSDELLAEVAVFSLTLDLRYASGYDLLMLITAVSVIF
jgi:hypothetical protein